MQIEQSNTARSRTPPGRQRDREAAKARKGRPPKFAGARKPVTVTLPERTLRQLDAIDRDRARAIVYAVEQLAGERIQETETIEKVTIATGTAVILVPESARLRSIPWLRLVQVAPGRFLMAVTTGTSIEEFELKIRDLVGELAPEELHERRVLEQLLGTISPPRKRRTVSKAEILFVPSDE